MNITVNGKKYCQVGDFLMNAANLKIATENTRRFLLMVAPLWKNISGDNMRCYAIPDITATALCTKINKISDKLMAENYDIAGCPTTPRDIKAIIDRAYEEVETVDIYFEIVDDCRSAGSCGGDCYICGTSFSRYHGKCYSDDDLERLTTIGNFVDRFIAKIEEIDNEAISILRWEFTDASEHGSDDDFDFSSGNPVSDALGSFGYNPNQY